MPPRRRRCAPRPCTSLGALGCTLGAAARSTTDRRQVCEAACRRSTPKRPTPTCSGRADRRPGAPSSTPWIDLAQRCRRALDLGVRRNPTPRSPSTRGPSSVVHKRPASSPSAMRTASTREMPLPGWSMTKTADECAGRSAASRRGKPSTSKRRPAVSVLARRRRPACGAILCRRPARRCPRGLQWNEDYADMETRTRYGCCCSSARRTPRSMRSRPATALPPAPATSTRAAPPTCSAASCAAAFDERRWTTGSCATAASSSVPAMRHGHPRNRPVAASFVGSSVRLRLRPRLGASLGLLYLQDGVIGGRARAARAGWVRTLHCEDRFPREQRPVRMADLDQPRSRWRTARKQRRVARPAARTCSTMDGHEGQYVVVCADPSSWSSCASAAPRPAAAASPTCYAACTRR